MLVTWCGRYVCWLSAYWMRDRASGNWLLMGLDWRRHQRHFANWVSAWAALGVIGPPLFLVRCSDFYSALFFRIGITGWFRQRWVYLWRPVEILHGLERLGFLWDYVVGLNFHAHGDSGLTFLSHLWFSMVPRDRAWLGGCICDPLFSSLNRLVLVFENIIHARIVILGLRLDFCFGWRPHKGLSDFRLSEPFQLSLELFIAPDCFFAHLPLMFQSLSELLQFTL